MYFHYQTIQTHRHENKHPGTFSHTRTYTHPHTHTYTHPRMNVYIHMFHLLPYYIILHTQAIGWCSAHTHAHTHMHIYIFIHVYSFAYFILLHKQAISCCSAIGCDNCRTHTLTNLYMFSYLYMHFRIALYHTHRPSVGSLQQTETWT